MSEEITLTLEPCDLCKSSVNVKIKKNSFKPSITGVSTLGDVHGLDNKVPSGVPQHVRILYVDERMSVRSYSVIQAIAVRK